jgi:AraC family transcriptional regulator, transcriptional activator of pobA
MREFDLSSALLLKQRLLQEGKSDLLFSRLSVKETAYSLHFFEPNHLMRFFKQMTRQAISEFIKSIK